MGYKPKLDLNGIFNAVRSGCSLYAACVKAGITTQEFYKMIIQNDKAREGYRLALADYADSCTDDIRAITSDLRAGNIDNSTAKLLIETAKWLAQKACPEPIFEMLGVIDDENGTATEIVVKFV